MTRNPNMREAILSAAELLFSTQGFNAVSIRDIALEAGANPGSITYHFKSKDGLLLEIYKRHCGPMNKRRIELLVAARRVRDVQDRLEAIVRAYVQPAFSSSSDLAGGGARFTRLRAVMSAEGNAVVGRIIAEIFDDTTNAFIEAIEESLPHLPRTTIVWRSQFRHGGSDRATRRGNGRLAPGVRRRSHRHRVPPAEADPAASKKRCREAERKFDFVNSRRREARPNHCRRHHAQADDSRTRSRYANTEVQAAGTGV
jgi:AcrR family transcriptional regulator